MSEPRILQVLSEVDGVSVAEVSGGVNPVVVLDDNTMSTVLLLMREIREELPAERFSDCPAVGRMLDGLSEIVEQYRTTRNKYYGDVSGPVSLANRIRELDQMLEDLQQFTGPKK